MKKDIHRTMTIRGLAAAISCVTVVFFASPALLHAAIGGSIEPPQFWNNDTGNQIAVASVLDSKGNIIITGTSNKNGTDDFYTIKIKADRSGVLWRSTFDLASTFGLAPGSDQAVAVAVDSDDNVIVTGVGNRGGVKKEIVTIKYCGKDVGTPSGYDPPIPGTPYPGLCTAGQPIWTATYDGPARGNDYPTSLAVDADKNIYVGGYGQSLSGGDNDYILLKYAPAGPSADGSPTWQRSFSGEGLNNDQITDVTTCSIPNSAQYFVAVTGHIKDSSGSSRIHTMKYSSTGTLYWKKTLTDKIKVDTVAPRIDMDSSCNVVVAGSVVGSGSNDIYVIKYAAANGDPLWNYSYAGSGDDQLNDIYIDANNDVFLAGMTYKNLEDDNFYTARLNGTTTRNQDRLIWEKQYNSGYWDTAQSVVVDNATNSVYVLGVTLDNNNDYDFLTIKYSLADGSLLWDSPFDSAIAAGGNQNDWPIGLSLNAAGEVLVTGYIDAVVSGISLDYYAIKYVPGLLDPPTDLIASTRSETKVALSWSDNSGNETGFEIHRSTQSFEISNDSFIFATAANVTAYNDSSVAANTRYYYRVRARTVAGQVTNFSHSSNQVTTLTTILNYPSPSWLFTYNGTGNGNDMANGIAVGPDRNPVVTGAGINNMGYSNYLTMKLDRSNDSRILWYDYNNKDGADHESAYDVAVATDNGIIITGTASLYVAPSKSYDIKTLELAASGTVDGNPVWESSFDNAAKHGLDYGKIVAYSSATNTWAMAGYGEGSNGTDIYVATFDRYGNPLWPGGVKKIDSGGYDYPTGIIFDSHGNLIVGGNCKGNGDVSNGAYDILLLKYNNDSTGTNLWTKTYDHRLGDDRSSAITIDDKDDIYITGYVTNDSSKNIYTAKYSSTSGQRLWHKTYDGPAHGDDTAAAITFDRIGKGEIIVGGTRLSAANNHDFFIVRYAPADGTVIREIPLDREFDDDHLLVMGTDLSGSMCVVGTTGSTSGSEDIIGVRYDWNGVYLGSMKFDGSGHDNDLPLDVTANTYGEIFVAGKTKNAANNFDYLVLKCPEGRLLQAPYPFNLTTFYTSANLSWADTNANESSYQIERDKKVCLENDSVAKWDKKVIATLDANSTSYTDLELDLNNQTYCYRIRAIGNNDKDPSRWLYAQITTYNPPPPTELTATKIDTTGIKLDWFDNTYGETQFIVERCDGLNCYTNDSKFQEVGYPAANAQSWNDLSLCEGMTYSYRIKAHNSDSNTWTTNNSNTVVNVSTDAMAAPTNLKAARSSEGRINLSWSDANLDETGFKIYRCQNDSCTSFKELTTLQPNPTEALAFYHLDNGRYTGITNEVRDSSGNGYHATAHGNAESVPTGKKGRAVSFDGINSYLSTSLKVDQSSSASKVTMAAWVYPASTSAGYHNVINTGDGGYDWSILRQDNAWKVSNGTDLSDPGFTVDVNSWQHIAAVFQNGTVVFYKNGVPSAPFNTSYDTSTNTIAIGANPQAFDFYDGKIDEVAIYDRALSTEELEVLYNNHLSDANPDRALYLKMNESSWTGVAADVKDLTVNQLHGQSFNVSTSNGANTIDDLSRGRVGNFNGIAATSGGYINLGTPAALKATGSQTIAFWVYPDNFTYRSSPYYKAYGGEGAIVFETNGTVRYYYGTTGANSGSTYQSFTLTQTLTAETWTHLAVVRDLGAMKLRWYKNGVMINETAASYSAAVASNLNAYIGNFLSGQTYYFDGKIDDFMILNRPLSTEEIANVYQSTLQASYSDTNVLPNTSYRYQVSAFNNDSSCHWESSPTSIARNDSTLGNPANLSFIVLHNTKVQLSWQDNFEFENGYVLQRCDATKVATCDNDSDFADDSKTFGPTITAYNDSTVFEDRTYAFRVKAANTTVSGWESAYSNTVTVNFKAKAVPYDFNVSRVNEEEIRLTWSTADTDQDGFQVFRSPNSCTSFSLLKTLGQGVNTYTDQHLSPNSTYCYQVRAFKNQSQALVNNSWSTDWAALSSGGSNTATTTIYTPAFTTAITTSTTTIGLAWNDPNGTETDYVIERCTGVSCSEGDYVQIGLLGRDSTSYTDSSSAICQADTYKYRVRAVDNGLTSGLGSCWQKKKKINISNFIANYPMRLEIIWDSNMQTDFDDIRFYDETYKHEIPYWLESKTDGSKAYVWIMTGDNNDIYLYCMNPTAVSASDPSSVEAFSNSAYYEFFDNFAGRRSSIDSSKWVEIDGLNKITQNNDLLLDYVSNQDWDTALISQKTFTRVPGKSVYAGISLHGSGQSDFFMLGWELDQTTNAYVSQLVHGLFFNNGQCRVYEKGEDKAFKTERKYERAGNDYEVNVKLTSTGASYWIRGGGGSYNYGSTWNEIETENNYTDQTMRLAFHQKSHKARVNWVAVKIWPATEPTYTFAQASAASCPTAPNHLWTGPYSAPVAVLKAATPTSAPWDIKATAESDSSLRVTWKQNPSDEDIFYLQRCNGDNDSCPVGNDSIFSLVAPVTASKKSSSLTSALPPELALYFDEASWNGTMNQVADSSGKGVNATAYGGASTVLDEVRGQVGKFDGSDDYVKIPGNDTLQHTTDSSYTFAAWVKPTNKPANVDSAPTYNDQHSGILQRAYSGLRYTYGKRFIMRTYHSTGQIDTRTTVQYEPGFWHHVAGVVNDSAKTISIYVDGAWQSQTTYTGTLQDHGTDPYYVGVSNPGTSYTWYFEGLIDEARIFNKALSATEVQTLYAGPATNAYTYTDTGLRPNKTYTYRIIAAKNSGNCTWNLPSSSTATDTTDSAPAPTEFSATTDASNAYSQINLSWKDNTYTNTGFIVERSDAPCSTYYQIASLSGNDTTYSDTNACPGTSYCYRLKAINEAFDDLASTLSNNGNTPWSRRKALNITNFQANYQTKLEIAWDPDMQENFADIRFFDPVASPPLELPYWIEKQTNGVSATVWLKTGNNNSIKMYYGNPNASSSSNGDSVFIFFDDFNNGIIDSGKWYSMGGANSGISESNGELHVTKINGFSYYLASKSFFSGATAPPFALTVRTQTTSTPLNGWNPVIWFQSDSYTGGASILELPYQSVDKKQIVCKNGTQTDNFFYKPIEGWHQNSIILKSTSSMRASVEFETATSRNWSYDTSYTTPANKTYGIYIGPPDSVNRGQQTFHGLIDWIFMRKWVATEPTVTVAAEEQGSVSWQTAYTTPVNTQALGTPTPASNVLATSVSENAINLSWNDSLSNEDGYMIKRCAGEGCTDYILINTQSSNFSDNFENDFQLSARNSNLSTVASDFDPPIYSADAYATAKAYWANDSSGHFAFTTTGTDPGTWAVAVANIGLVNPMRLGAGDFDVQATYKLTGTSALGQNMAYLTFFAPGNYLPVFRNQNGYGVTWQAKGNDSDPAVTNNPVVFGVEEKLRLTRKNNVITAYFWNNGSWQTLKQYTTLMDSSLVPSVIQLTGTAVRNRLNNWDTGFSQLKIISPTVTYYDFGTDLKLQNWTPSGYINHASAPTSDTVPPIDITTSQGSAKISWDNGKIVMRTTSANVGDSKLNYSTLTLKDASSLLGAGDFDVQIDYNIPSYTVSAQTVHYARFLVDFINGAGANTFSIQRLNNTEHNASITINDVTETASLYDNQSSSGKLRLVRNQNFLSAYTWFNNEWKLVKTHSQPLSAAAKVGNLFIKQLASRNDALNVTTELDNFKLTKASGLYQYSDTGMSAGVPYTYKVYPYRNNGCSNWSNYATGTSITLTSSLTAPTGLSATAITTTSINLTWVDTTSSETGFELDRCTGNNCDFTGPDTVTFTVGANVNSYADLTPMASTTYSYRVRAVNSDSQLQSDYSATLSDKTTLTPQPPSGLTVTWGSEINLKLAWTDNSTDETNFMVERGNESCGASSFKDIVTLGAGSTSYNASNLLSNTTYCYRVRAYKNTSLANSWYSGYTDSVSKETTIKEPSDLVATASAFNSNLITLSWKDRTETETGFEIKRCLGASASCKMIYVGKNIISYQDNSVCDSSLYSYWVRPIQNDSWNTNYSPVASATAKSPAPPSDFTVTEIYNDSSASKQIQLYWENNNADESGFTIERCIGDDCSFDTPVTSTMPTIQSYDTFDAAITAPTYWTLGGEIQWKDGQIADNSLPINYSNDKGMIKVTASGDGKVELYAQTAYLNSSETIIDRWTQAFMKLTDPSIVGAGDFDLQVTFRLPEGLSSSYKDHRYLKMLLTFPDGDGDQRQDADYVYIEYKINTNNTNSYSSSARVSSVIQSASVQTMDEWGKLRIVRDNGKIFTYYWNQDTNAWVALLQHGTATTFSLAPDSVQFSTKAHYLSYTPVTLRTEIEEFRIFKSSFSYTDKGLDPSVTYRYRVVPYKMDTPAGCSTWENRSGLYTPIGTERTRPIAPDGLEAISDSNNVIKLKWNDNATDEDGYEIERLTWNGHYLKIYSSYDRDTIYADTDKIRTYITSAGNEPGMTYTYRVRAYRTKDGVTDYSTYSSPASATTGSYNSNQDYDHCPHFP